MIVMELDQVQKSFGKLRAVQDVSLRLESGVVTGLIGRNGAGKTTTIRMIMNIYQPDEGAILCDGQVVGADFRDRVGYLPEERGLYGKMRVLDALLFFAEIKSAPRALAEARANEYLTRFGLADRTHDKIETLSKGNQQKVQFIAAIIHDPEIVILDEPFSGLDPVNTTLMIDAIDELKRQGKAILFSTHIMDFAERLCDHVALVDGGRIILEGSIADVKRNNASNRVSIVSDSDLDFVETLPYVASVDRTADVVDVVLRQDGNVQVLLAELVRREVSVTRFDASPVTLHDIFVSLVGDSDASTATEELQP